MTSLAHKTVLKIDPKVELLHCCALQSMHDTDQHNKHTVATGETSVIVKATCSQRKFI